jgi:hypothetical protein
MKTLLLILATFNVAAFGAPALKVTNRQYEDGGGSSKEVDPEKKQAIESFITGAGKLQYRIIYQLDDRLQPLSGVYYNAAGRVFQKSAYKLDGADRIIQEVIYDGTDKLVCTKNYIYGTRGGKDKVVAVDTYDPNGRLIPTVKKSSGGGGGRRR